MSDVSTQIEQVDEIITSTLGLGAEEFDDSTPIGPEGLEVDSIAMVEIAERIEMRLDITISDEELDEFGGKTVGDLKTLVEERADASA